MTSKLSNWLGVGLGTCQVVDVHFGDFLLEDSYFDEHLSVLICFSTKKIQTKIQQET